MTSLKNHVIIWLSRLDTMLTGTRWVERVYARRAFLKYSDSIGQLAWGEAMVRNLLFIGNVGTARAFGLGPRSAEYAARRFGRNDYSRY